jgi:hypothetical protein
MKIFIPQGEFKPFNINKGMKAELTLHVETDNTELIIIKDDKTSEKRDI